MIARMTHFSLSRPMSSSAHTMKMNTKTTQNLLPGSASRSAHVVMLSFPVISPPSWNVPAIGMKPW